MFKKMPAISRVCELILKYSIYIVAFLTPIFFLPWTSDVLDFNKQALLVLFSFLALFAWMVKTLISGRFSLNLNKIHFAAIALFLVYLLSTIFSLDKYGSFWGWPRVTSESFLTIITFLIIYFVISNVFDKRQILKSVTILAISGMLAILIGIFQSLGLFLPFSFAKSTSFNTVGLVGNLGLFAAVLLPLLIILEVYAKKWMKIVFGAGIGLAAICLVVANYIVVWWIVLAGCVVLLVFGVLKKNLFDLRWLGIPMFFLVLSLFFILLRVQLPVPQRAIEIYLKQSAGLDITLKTLKNSPLFGSGPGTFAYDFSQYKSDSLNQGLLWNTRFDSAGSKILTTLATTGILGFVSWLVLIGTAIFYGVKFALKRDKPEEQNGEGVRFYVMGLGIIVAFMCQILAYFLYSSSLSLDFVFFFLLACIVGFVSARKKEFILNPSSFLTLGVTFVFTLFFIFGLGLLILDGQRYMAETNYLRGVSDFVSGQKDQGISKLENAVSMNSKSDIYLTQLSQAYLSKLTDVVNDATLSDSDKNTMVQVFVNNSINAAKIATDVSPKNVSNWSIRGFVYKNLIGLVPDSDTWAIKMYDEAINLEPLNPYYPNQKGLVYMSRAVVNKDNIADKNTDLANAKKEFDRAVELKSDYAPALFQIAMVYQAQGKTDQEVRALEDAKKASPNDVGLLFQIGLLYYQEGNFSKAKTNLEVAVSLSPNYANALYFLGLAYSKLGQDNEAIEQFEKILSLNPDNAEIKTILANLQAGKNPLSGIVQETPPQAPVEETPPENSGK